MQPSIFVSLGSFHLQSSSVFLSTEGGFTEALECLSSFDSMSVSPPLSRGSGLLFNLQVSRIQQTSACQAPTPPRTAPILFLPFQVSILETCPSHVSLQSLLIALSTSV